MLNLNSILIATMKPTELAAFYEKVIGKPADMMDSEAGISGWMVCNGFLGVLKHSEMHGDTTEPGRILINFDTRQVQEEFERIKDLGAKVIRAPCEIGGGWVATLADPDGNYFQLMSPMSE